MLRRPSMAFIGAGLVLALLIITWLLAFHVGVFERADQSIFSGFGGFDHHPRVDRLASFIAELCNPSPYVFLVAVPVTVALVRRRFWVTVAIGTIVLGANVTTQLLKPLLAHPRAGSLLGGTSPISPASWPSGHATAAMSLALVCVLAAPARLRPLVATLGAVFAVAVSYSFLTLGWHYPSDVFGGFLVAACWTLLAIAGVLLVGGRQATGVPETGSSTSVRAALTPPALLLLGAVALVVVVAVARPHEVVTYARAHRVFMIGAGAIAATAMVIAAGFALTLRRRPRA